MPRSRPRLQRLPAFRHNTRSRVPRRVIVGRRSGADRSFAWKFCDFTDEFCGVLAAAKAMTPRRRSSVPGVEFEFLGSGLRAPANPQRALSGAHVRAPAPDHEFRRADHGITAHRATPCAASRCLRDDALSWVARSRPFFSRRPCLTFAPRRAMAASRAGHEKKPPRLVPADKSHRGPI